MKNTKTQTRLTKSQIKERGWTDKAIELFLGEPDETKRNPIYRSAPPMKLWEEEKVKAIEKSETFIQWQEKSSKRKDSASKAVETKTQKLIDEINNIEIYLPDCDDPFLMIKAACHHYNEHHREFLSERNKLDELHKFELGWGQAHPDSTSDFLKRIIYNFIRHELTDYEIQLRLIKYKTGKGDAYSLLRDRIFDCASEKYPWLESDEFWYYYEERDSEELNKLISEFKKQHQAQQK